MNVPTDDVIFDVILYGALIAIILLSVFSIHLLIKYLVQRSYQIGLRDGFRKGLIYGTDEMKRKNLRKLKNPSRWEGSSLCWDNWEKEE